MRLKAPERLEAKETPHDEGIVLGRSCGRTREANDSPTLCGWASPSDRTRPNPLSGQADQVGVWEEGGPREPEVSPMRDGLELRSGEVA